MKFTSHFFKDGDYNTDTLFAQFMTIQEEQILLRVIEIHKKMGVMAHISEIIECVHDGHVGGPKQYNDFPLGNIFYFYANILFCFSPPTWRPCTHSIEQQ